MFDLRLIRAEVLKLRRRRGMLAIAAASTIGAVLLAFTVSAVQHASDPGKYGPAGGLGNYLGVISFLTIMVVVVGAIVGSTAGAQDLETGVFRDSAATGRSRLALFGARIPGALAVVLPLTAVAAALSAVAAVALSGSLAAPTASAIVAGTSGVLVAGVLSTVIAVALAALIGSRGPVIAIVLAFELAISQLLLGLSFLGDVREAIPHAALARIGHSPDQALPIGLGVAFIVVIAWAAAAFAAGAWKTRTREI
jgi:hypothetical protein